MLLTGDIGAPAELQLLRRWPEGALRADLLKVAHHGSINASPEWGYEVVFPARRSGNKVIICTDSTRYTGPNEVPKAEVLEGWRSRVRSKTRMKSTDGIPLGASLSFYYRG